MPKRIDAMFKGIGVAGLTAAFALLGRFARFRGTIERGRPGYAGGRRKVRQHGKVISPNIAHTFWKSKPFKVKTMAFSKSEDSQHECPELANDANTSMKIREIRPFALFAFQIGQSVKRL
jgi:hypothetical protein